MTPLFEGVVYKRSANTARVIVRDVPDRGLNAIPGSVILARDTYNSRRAGELRVIAQIPKEHLMVMEVSKK